jgi:hypothetical protein
MPVNDQNIVSFRSNHTLSQQAQIHNVMKKFGTDDLNLITWSLSHTQLTSLIKPPSHNPKLSATRNTKMNGDAVLVLGLLGGLLFPLWLLLAIILLGLLISGICWLFNGIFQGIIAIVKWIMGPSHRESDPEQPESAGTEMQPPAYDAGEGPAVRIEEGNDALPSQPLPAYTP